MHRCEYFLRLRRTHRELAMPHHLEQDLQSLLLHEAAVRLLQKDPSLTKRLIATLDRWSLRDDINSRGLEDRWRQIIDAQDWDAAVARTEEGPQLRQASPLATLLPDEDRLAILRTAKALSASS